MEAHNYKSDKENDYKLKLLQLYYTFILIYYNNFGRTMDTIT